MSAQRESGDLRLAGIERERLVRFCRGYLRDADEAEDAASEVLCKLLEEEGTPERIDAWLHRVARNLCLNRVRAREQRGAMETLDSELALAASVTGNLTRLAREEERQRLASAVAALSESERELLRLRYTDELSREAIAELLELTVSVVKSRLFEAVEKLRRSDR